MPDYYLRVPDGKSNWYICWTECGKPKRISTGESSREAARRALDRFIKVAEAPKPQEKTIAYVIAKYKAFKKAQIEERKQKVRNYEAIDFALRPVEAEMGYIFAEALERQHSRDFNTARLRLGFAPSTVRKNMEMLAAAMNHAKREGVISRVPPIERARPSAPRKGIVTPEQAKAFLSYIETPHIKTFATIALHTLARTEAILELKWEQVDFDSLLIDFNHDERMITKKRRATNPINRILLAELQTAHELRSTEWVIEYGGKPVECIKKAFRNNARDCKMPWLTPHVLRHSGASHMAAAGVPLPKIAEYMADDEATVRKHYLKFTPDYLKSVSEALEKIYA